VFQKPVQPGGHSEPPRRVPILDTTSALIPPKEQFSLRRDWSEFNQRDPPSPPSGGRTSNDQAGAGIEPTFPPAPCDLSSRPASDGFSVPPRTPDSHLKSTLDFRILGVLGKLYIVMENGDGLVLVDQHAAHERVLFEKLRKQMESAGVPIQRLLIPLTVNVTPKDYDWILTNAPTLEKMGFALEPFGDSTLKIDGIPPFFPKDDPGLAIRKLVDELRSITTATSRLRMGEDAIAKTVCRHAIK